MKSEPHPEGIKLSYESEDSNDVDDPGQSDNETVTSTEEEKMEVEEIQRINNSSGGNYGEGEKFTSHTVPSDNFSANFFFEELTPDDEILTFQCPENFDMNSLLNQALDLNKVTKIKQSGTKFKCQVLANDKKTLTCIFPSKEGNAALVKMPVSGHIVIRKNIKLPKRKVLVFEEIDKTDKIKIKDSMVRHPLLGKNWDDHLRAARKQIKKQKKLLKKAMEHRKSLLEAERERKEKKRKLKAQLSLLKKNLSTDLE